MDQHLALTADSIYIALAEQLLDAAFGVHDLLLAGVDGMASRADIDADVVAAIRAGKSANPDFRLTTDGVHMNAVSNHVMALTLLATLGFARLEA